MTQSAPKTAAELCEAFAEFESASATLTAFYTGLERQVAGLAAELAASRAGQARELAEKERLAQRLESLLDALPAGVVVLDGQGRVQECNPAAVELLGPLGAGDDWAEVARRVFAPRWDDGHDISLADGRVVNLATQALGGEPGQILLLKDVTETRRLQEQLAHHKRISAKTEMAAAMAHQIRTPLAAALLNVGNLKRATADPALSSRAAERALKSLRRLERLVDEMLLFARGGNLAVSRVTVGELLARIARTAEEAFASDRFALECQAVGSDAEVWANTEALTSIALNLVDNAHQACDGTGAVRIAAELTARSCRLVFEDDGPGIPADAREKIFEPFHTTRANGTGLGLSVARAVARAHAGDLAVDAAPGGGARFTLTLPLIEAGAAAPAVRLAG